MTTFTSIDENIFNYKGNLYDAYFSGEICKEYQKYYIYILNKYLETHSIAQLIINYLDIKEEKYKEDIYKIIINNNYDNIFDKQILTDVFIMIPRNIYEENRNKLIFNLFSS